MVGVVALLLVPVSLVVSHPVNVVGEAAVLALCVWYVARVMRADRRRRHAAEAALPPALRPARRQPRRPIAFQLHETGLAFVRLSRECLASRGKAFGTGYLESP